MFVDQIRWKYFKYEIRKISIHFSVSEAKKRNKEIKNLENKKKKLLKRIWLTRKVMKSILNVNVIKIINDQKIESIQIRSKCNWYKDGKKISIFFLNVEKN